MAGKRAHDDPPIIDVVERLDEAVVRRLWIHRRAAGRNVGRREAGEQLGISRELPCVLERQAGGADALAGDGQRGDLDDLALTAGGRASLLLRPGDVSTCGNGVSTVSRQHGKQGVLDGAHLGVHPSTILPPADPGLTPR